MSITRKSVVVYYPEWFGRNGNMEVFDSLFQDAPKFIGDSIYCKQGDLYLRIVLNGLNIPGELLTLDTAIKVKSLVVDPLVQENEQELATAKDGLERIAALSTSIVHSGRLRFDLPVGIEGRYKIFDDPEFNKGFNPIRRTGEIGRHYVDPSNVPPDKMRLWELSSKVRHDNGYFVYEKPLNQALVATAEIYTQWDEFIAAQIKALEKKK